MSVLADARAVEGSPAGTGRPRMRVSDRVFQATAASCVTLLAGLALVLNTGPGVLIGALAVIGGTLAVLSIARPAVSLLRGHRELILLAVPLAASVIWIVTAADRLRAAADMTNAQTGFGALTGWGKWQLVGQDPPFSWPWPVGHVAELPLVLMALTAVGGLVLVSDAARVRLGLAPRQRAPWKHLTAPDPGPPSFAWRAVTGVLLVGFAAALAISALAPSVQGNSGGQVGVLLLVGTAAAAFVGVPLVVGSRMRLDRDKGAIARERERQRFAAHLHDSVLQTLALVQRQAHDPAAVTRLARRQEHALRAWLAGEAELRSDTLVAALRDAVAEVEDEDRITVELTAIGDRPLDQAGEALVAAAREALRNAARHAEGASVVMFAEVARDRSEVFVRDDGPGFALDDVPAERRGIRDAIIGRMASAGGSGSVESAPGEGTEVALRLGTGGPRQ